MRIRITYLLTVIIAFLLLIIGNKTVATRTVDIQNPSQEIVRAKVQRIVDHLENNLDFLNDFDDFDEYDDYYDYFPPMVQGKRIIFEAKITNGTRKGEIVQALAGSFGILSGIPLTALFCSILYMKDNKY